MHAKEYLCDHGKILEDESLVAIVGYYVFLYLDQRCDQQALLPTSNLY